nr:hypothetical protein [Tanacetum cinerariifolium]
SQTKSSSTSLNSLLEETTNFHNSLPAGFITFSNVLFDADYDSNYSDDQSLFDEDVPKKIYSNPLFDEEIIPIEIDPHSFNAESNLIESMPNNDSSIIIPSKIDSLFDEDFTKDVVEDISPMKEPQVLTVLPTHPTLQLNMKFQPSSESLFAYVVWIFLPYLVYSVVSCYLLSLRNEDIIFDPGICKSTFSKPD